ncbi:MAG: chorismate mutase [bacterium]|nr:chorismate mutase [bacterium]
MKQANECTNMEEIREEIDNIDLQIVKLIGKRSDYVHAASKYKKTSKAVKAEDRVKFMLEKRRIWAKENNIETDFIEKLFSSIVTYFISKEMKRWKEEN